ncbi:pyrroline-5-carboxylate reductase [Agromyces flavus]|uniref:Pyrroline-5-carboxylate reductase n=1 Tax=Agromyces flavus TaxID=589382 RepID=A0A1H1XZP3_9MICO|nr:pyrroline-5-carboxylate reductase [Agromyces flavus]MCP2366544.1 pyrroline-5-carboxylate reductase [Agromyces flavus]GGI44886.1 pyrroline-5-carboxylate reductase [Agromyces flavus]SDT14419.1 pyrroline-5-carboxylate reductase [Agromyces flavus]
MTSRQPVDRPIELPSIAFLGAGSMARAILAGLLQPHVTVAGGIRTTNRSAARAAEFDAEPRVTAYATEADAAANRRAVAGAKLVVVAVKPAMVPDLLDEIADALEPGSVVVSVAAGVTVATFEAHLPSHVSVVRTMPNTPAVVGRAVTGVSAGTRSSGADLALVVSLFETVGEVLVVPESQLDALSTISGSGPAYVFLLIEELTKSAIAKGFTREEAAVMVQGTFRGASELLAASGDDPAELRRRVTSPKGTTERAIAVLQEADLSALFDRATDAALARARELAAGA